ncbi:unnamed protein product [Caenorhabditis auriculariae]|uniref:SH3 domain-containing protein n=1 Tax=Caenorhabditis auriculariae TaxID=2777116 RepID=A0A8S1GX83_9PELO|nr:unnamed protein product [Caenorhabditis auriculariae]
MSAARRRASLDRISCLLDVELKRIYARGTADVMVANCRQLNSLEFIEYLYYKINDAINSVDGGQHRGFHRLARFQHKLKDKSGLPMTILTLPLTGEDNSLPPPSASQSSHYAASSRGSDEYEDYDKISDEGFYSSPSRQTTVIDDSASQTLCRVLYDFDPKHEDEIPIRAGQCVLVEDRIGDDWLVGHVISDPNFSESQVVPGSTPATGRFPTTYVAFLTFLRLKNIWDD